MKKVNSNFQLKAIYCLFHQCNTKAAQGNGAYAAGGAKADRIKPYGNTLTQTELETLTKMYRKSEVKDEEILFHIINKYGADKLRI